MGWEWGVCGHTRYGVEVWGSTANITSSILHKSIILRRKKLRETTEKGRWGSPLPYGWSSFSPLQKSRVFPWTQERLHEGGQYEGHVIDGVGCSLLPTQNLNDWRSHMNLLPTHLNQSLCSYFKTLSCLRGGGVDFR